MGFNLFQYGISGAAVHNHCFSSEDSLGLREDTGHELDDAPDLHETIRKRRLYPHSKTDMEVGDAKFA